MPSPCFLSLRSLSKAGLLLAACVLLATTPTAGTDFTPSGAFDTFTAPVFSSATISLGSGPYLIQQPLSLSINNIQDQFGAPYTPISIDYRPDISNGISFSISPDNGAGPYLAMLTYTTPGSRTVKVFIDDVEAFSQTIDVGYIPVLDSGTYAVSALNVPFGQPVSVTVSGLKDQFSAAYVPTMVKVEYFKDLIRVASDDFGSQPSYTSTRTLADQGSYTTRVTVDNVLRSTLNFNVVAPALVSVNAPQANAVEGGSTGTFQFSRTGDPTQALEVSYTIGGTATNGRDYTPMLNGTVTLPAGAATVDVVITPVSDSTDEGSETVVLTLVDAASYDLGSATTATVTIADPNEPGSLVVTTTNDSSTNTDNQTSLREALAHAHSLGGPQTITFAPALAGQTLTLSAASGTASDLQFTSALRITGDITVQGPATAPGVTLAVDAAAQRRHFLVEGGGSLTLSRLTLSGGNVQIGGFAYGGAVWSFGSLTVRDCTFTGNTAAQEGGAIQVWGGSPLLLVENSTFSGNTSPNGSAINAGAVSMALRHLTLTANTGNNALTFWGHPATLTHSIVAGNTADGIALANSATLTAQSTHNLLGTGSTAGLVNGENGNLTGITTPLLGPLQDNGGPTPTHALLPGSPAIDAGGLTSTPAFLGELFANSAVSSLLGLVDFNGNGILVAPLFPVGSLLQIGTEQVIVTRYFAADILTVQRGANGTIATAHPAGTPIGFAGDQRGQPRVVKGLAASPTARIDIGAYELFAAPTFTNSALTLASGSGPLDLAAAAGVSPAGGSFSGTSVDGTTGTFDPTGLALGSYTVTYTVNDSFGAANNATFTVTVTEAPSLIVTTTADTVDATDGQTSLREALAYAATLTGPQTITFSNTTANGAVNFHDGTARTITLGGTELAIASDVTVTGPGADKLTISGNHASRIFNVASGTTVDISGLTVADGHAPDGAGSTTSLTGTLGESGGGITNAGTLTLTGVVVTGNSAGTGGSARNPLGIGGKGGAGGGIHNSDILTLNDCTLSGNTAGMGGAAGAVGEGGNGGGIHSSGTLTLNRTTVSGNQAGSSGTQDGGSGGGIYSSGPAALNQCTISGNITGGSTGSGRAGTGGGIYSTATLTITGSRIEGNTLGAQPGSTGGGGIYSNGALTITHSSIIGNSLNGGSGFGAGITLSLSPPTKLINCTISGHTTVQRAAAINSFGTRLSLWNCTISGNSTGIYVNGNSGQYSVLTLANTLLANTGANLSTATSLGGTATITSLGHNLSSDGGSSALTATGDLIHTDPLLGPLQDNGGATPTHALLPGSPAIDAGDPDFDPADFTPPLSTDQRGTGFPRVVKGSAASASARMDIGAYEAPQVVAEIAVFDGASTAPGDQRADDTGVVAFGDQTVNTSSTARTFTIQNAGTDVLVLGTVALAGADAAHFTVTQPAETELMPTETTTFTVAFAPTSTNVKTARVEIPSSDAGTPLFRIPLSGTGTAVTIPTDPVDVVVSGSFMLPAQGLVGGGRLYRPLTGVINDAGRVALRVMGQTGTGGITSGSDSLLLSDTSGSLRAVAREGDLVRVSPWQTLTGGFAGLLLTDAGQVVFQDKIRGAPAATDMGYFSSPDGLALELASREGDAAPGGGTFITHTGTPAVDAQGRVYFRGQVRGLPATQDTGVWMRHGGTLTRLFAEGQNVTSLTGDPAWAGQIGAFLAAGGDGAAFAAVLQNNPAVKTQRTDVARNAAVFSVDAAANAALVARKGGSVPGAPGAQIFRFDGLARSSIGTHALRVLLRPAPAASDEALIFVKDGATQLVAREGVTVVTGAATVAKFGHFHVTAADEVVFLATLKGGGVSAANDGALCRWTQAGGIELLAREGAPAPGLGGNYIVLQAVSVSPGGAVLLQTTLSGGRVALLRDTGSGLEKVAATGDVILVNGTPRNILALAMHRDGVNLGGGGGGMGAAINDSGAVLSIISCGDGVHTARVWP